MMLGHSDEGRWAECHLVEWPYFFVFSFYAVKIIVEVGATHESFLLLNIGTINLCQQLVLMKLERTACD